MADPKKKPTPVRARRGGGGSYRAPLDLRANPKNKPQGIAALGAGIGGGLSDLGRGFGNTLSDVGDFFGGRAPSTKAGSQVFGPDQKIKRRLPDSPFNKGADTIGQLTNGLLSRQQAQPVEAEKTFADYLNMANELVGGGTDYGALEGQLRKNGAEGDARLQAMYNQLRSSIDADAPGIQQNYDSAGAALNKNADAAAAATKQAADAARAQQAQQFGALGIQEGAQQVLASQGSAAAGDQAAALGNIEQNRLANVNQNAVNKSSAVNYNTGVGNAAGLEGNIQRAALQQALANKIAELQTAKSEESAQRQSSVLERAMQLQQGDQSGQAEAAQQEFENQLAAQKLALQAAKSQGSQVTLEDQLGRYTELQGAAQKSGVGDDQFSEWLKNFVMASKLG